MATRLLASAFIILALVLLPASAARPVAQPDGDLIQDKAAHRSAPLVNTVELERVAAGLREELEQSRAQTAIRVRDAKAGLETALQLTQAELARQKTETFAARAIAGTKDAAIDALQAQVAALQAKPDAAKAVAEVAKQAVVQAAKVAEVRHAEYSAALSSDHDLLVAISVRMDSMREAIDQERGAVTGRLAKAETDIASLEASRTQFAGYAAGAGAVFMLLIGLASKFLGPMLKRKI